MVGTGCLTLTNYSAFDLLYIKNTGTATLHIDLYIILTKTSIGGAGGRVDIEILRNPTSGTVISDASEITPVNVNFGSNRVPIATFYKGGQGKTLSGYTQSFDTKTTDDNRLVLPVLTSIPQGASAGIRVTPPAGDYIIRCSGNYGGLRRLMKLEDGKGQAFVAQVDDENRLRTFAVTESEDRHIAKETGKVWSIDLDDIAINADVYVAYFQNNSTVNYHLTDMRVHCQDAASIVDIDEISVGTIGAATSFQPSHVASRNIGLSVSPVGDMYYASAATGITGLTKVKNIFHAGDLDNQSSHLRTTSNVVIPPGAALGVLLRTANATNGVVFTWSLV